VFQEPNESLGMRIGGGLGSNEGDIPIYIANIHPQGCVGKTQQILVSLASYLFYGQQIMLLKGSCRQSKSIQLTKEYLIITHIICLSIDHCCSKCPCPLAVFSFTFLSFTACNNQLIFPHHPAYNAILVKCFVFLC
jgi:hypothetical protein